MVAVTRAGGPYGRGNFRTTWRGATVLQQWQAQIQAGMERVAAETLAELTSTLHRVSEEMADNAFATVAVRGTKRTIVAGSTAPHTAYHELGTTTFEGHPQIRGVVDRQAPRVTQSIAAARRGG